MRRRRLILVLSVVVLVLLAGRWVQVDQYCKTASDTPEWKAAGWYATPAAMLPGSMRDPDTIICRARNRP